MKGEDCWGEGIELPPGLSHQMGGREAVQGYLDHKKHLPPQDHHRSLGI